jgi:hypothetical protein
MGFTLFDGEAAWDQAGRAGIASRDTDGDLLPDYFEDSNGNGDENDATDWSKYGADSADTDGDGLLDLKQACLKTVLAES